MLPENYNVRLYRGDSFQRDLYFNDSEGNPIDMSNGTWRADIYNEENTNKKSEFAVAVDPEDFSHLVMTLSPEQTSKLYQDVYVYDLEHTKDDGTVRTYLAGAVLVTEDVSR